MGQGVQICIYCKQDKRTATFDGVEHVIPQAFGTFGSETPTLDCVCDQCNECFGKTLDIYLARETVEGVIRYRRGIYSSEKRPQKHLQITLDTGPETGRFAGLRVAIDGTRGELMSPLAQFQILNQNTGQFETYSKTQIQDLKLPENVYGKPGDDAWECTIFSTAQQDHDEMVDALRAIGIEFKPGTPFRMPEPTSHEDDSFPVVIKGEVTHTHRRAHAKILLSCIAYFLGSDEALKPHWDFLRRFARYGEGSIKYNVSDPRASERV